jgi:hypothetical protein
MAHDDNCNKYPQSEGSSRGSRSPPPHQMMMAGALSLFLAIGKEAGRWWEIVREDVGCVQERLQAL